jgi:hypothetical protein
MQPPNAVPPLPRDIERARERDRDRQRDAERERQRHIKVGRGGVRAGPAGRALSGSGRAFATPPPINTSYGALTRASGGPRARGHRRRA